MKLLMMNDTQSVAGGNSDVAVPVGGMTGLGLGALLGTLLGGPIGTVVGMNVGTGLGLALGDVVHEQQQQ